MPVKAYGSEAGVVMVMVGKLVVCAEVKMARRAKAVTKTMAQHFWTRILKRGGEPDRRDDEFLRMTLMWLEFNGSFD